MQRGLLLLSVVAFVSTLAFGQLTTVGEVNAYTYKSNAALYDSAYFNDQGVRRVFSGCDLDKDGKQEIIATDYAKGGRVHVFEWNNGALEMVWSSKKMFVTNPNSTPRWVKVGDLDGDGNQELVFPAGARYGGEVDVYEYTGVDNDYGTEPALTLPANYFITLGQLPASSEFRMDREMASVYDYDGDGMSELTMPNRNWNSYVLGVDGQFPGFAGWQIEGGADTTLAPEGANFSGGSPWHVFPANVTGTGESIVNHHWNHYGFWSMKAAGANKYRYPTPKRDSLANPNAAAKYQYHEYLPNDPTSDGVCYMGIQPADVDGDGKQELAGIIYIGNSPFTVYDYSVCLTSLAKGDTGMYVWKDSTQFGLIGTELWKLGGASLGSHWGIAAYDFDNDGKDEIYVGGFAGYNVVQLKYNGTGSVTDANNYSKSVVFPGDKASYIWVSYYDSLGIKTDTVYEESPFLSSIVAGSDVDGNGKKELVVSYQSIASEISHFYYHWDTTGGVTVWMLDTTLFTPNTNAVNIRVLEYTGTGFREIAAPFITPDDYILEQNYPNPFNPTTNIRFSLPTDKKISLVVYDILGREVRTLINGEAYKKGSHSFAWDGRTNTGDHAASGTYIYTLKFGNFSKSAKMALVR